MKLQTHLSATFQRQQKEILFETQEVEPQSLPREGISQCLKIPDSAEGKQQHKECIYYALRAQHRSPLLSVYTAVTPEASGPICSAVSTSRITHRISSGRPPLSHRQHPRRVSDLWHYIGKTGFLPRRNLRLTIGNQQIQPVFLNAMVEYTVSNWARTH